MATRVAYRCSFCGKPQEKVHRLIAGPGGVYICNECISLCTEIIAEEAAVHAKAPAGEAHWVKSTGSRQADEEVVARVTQAAEIETRVQALLAPLVTELAAARAEIERLAAENGALRERLYAPDLARNGDSPS